MALRFNPPPNWPAPPEGFEPPPGWQPDPAWGPAPEGWQIWVDDSVPASTSAEPVSAGADPASAPTQPASASPLVPTPAPPGSYSANPPAGDTTQPPGPGTDYAQAPPPFHSQPAAGPVPPGSAPSAPGGAGWQPVDVTGGLPGAPASKPVVKQWWFWTIIAAVLVVVLVLAVVVVNISRSDNRSGGSNGGQTSSQASKGSSGKAADSGDEEGTSPDNAIDPTAYDVTFESPDDPDTKLTVQFDPVTWDANSDLQAKNKYIYDPPPEGKVYITVNVRITYEGEGQYNKYDLDITYEHNGNTVEPETFIDDDSFTSQSMPRNGGSAEGYFAFLIDQDSVNSGNFVVSGFRNYSSEARECYVQAK